MFRVLPVAVAFAFVVPAGARAAAPDPLSVVTAAWHDLLSQDDATATRAILSLSARPKETVDFLRSNMLSLKADKGQIGVFIKQLADRDFHTRELAHRELLSYGKVLKPEIEEARRTTTNPEAQDRLRRLLSRIAIAEADEKALTEGDPLTKGGQPYINYVGNQPKVFVNGKPIDLTPRVVQIAGPPPMQLRAARAIAVLEHIGTPEAIQLLETVSTGDVSFPATRQAADALGRLKQVKK